MNAVELVEQHLGLCLAVFTALLLLALAVALGWYALSMHPEPGDKDAQDDKESLLGLATACLFFGFATLLITTLTVVFFRT
jgi:hypothetical protein